MSSALQPPLLIAWLVRFSNDFFQAKQLLNSKTTKTNMKVDPGLPLALTVAPREDQVYMAKLAEQAERYDGM